MNEINETAVSDREVTAKATARAFTEAEMIACEACLRANPPTRATCLYCAAGLPATEQNLHAQSAPAPTPAELDNGYQIVPASAPARDIAESSLAQAAALLELKAVELKAILNAPQPLPLARAATPEQATMLGDKLRAVGIENIMVADEELHLKNPAKRIRAIEFRDDSLMGIAAGGSTKLSTRLSDVILIVAGRLLVSRTEVEERPRGRRNQLLDSRELSRDESVLDLHLRSDQAGWRILADNFDFSCLGSEKKATAFANFKVLVNLLRERANDARFDDLYVRLRPALALVWPIEQQTRKGKSRGRGDGKPYLSTVTTADNEGQFTRYSRLGRYLKLRELEEGR